MTGRFVALLRAVNVGGTGKLPMADLKRMCEEAGFSRVETYIASGNVVFDAAKTEAEIRAALEAALTAYAGKPMDVLVRTGAEMAAVRDANPFLDAPANRVVALFLDAAPPPDILDTITARADEEVGVGTRELYIHYPSGQARTKLVFKGMGVATARNINTVARLAEMAAQ